MAKPFVSSYICSYVYNYVHCEYVMILHITMIAIHVIVVTDFT